MNIQYTFIVLLLFWKVTFSQEKNTAKLSQITLPEEKIHIATNNDLFISGERLYYQMTCRLKNNKLSPYSKVGYIEIINSNGKSILKQNVDFTKGIGYGDFLIQADIKTGTYKILAYTNLMRNTSMFFEKNVYLINPFSNKLKKQQYASIRKDTIKYTSDYLVEKSESFLKMNKSTFSKREKVKLQIDHNLMESNGKYSISIRKKNTFSLPKIKPQVIQLKKNNSNYYTPELRGAILRGKVTHKDSKVVSGLKLALSVNEKALPITTITNSKGLFYFNIPNLNKEKVYLTVLEEEMQNLTIEQLYYPTETHKTDTYPELFYQEDLAKAIANRSIQAQVENAYYKVKRDSIHLKKEKHTFLDNLKTTYKLDDYKRFKSVRKTFIEVIQGAGFIKVNGQSKLDIIYTGPAKNRNNLSTLLLIDGQIINNHHKILNYDARKIESISLIKDKYYYGNKTYKGVVWIKTFANDYLENFTSDVITFEVSPTQPMKTYFFQNEKFVKNERIPDFRTQLYWNPNVDITQKEIIFYTSDITGDFEICIEGFNQKGDFLHSKQAFSVQ